MSKKTLILIISIVGAVETAVNVILGFTLPEGKKEIGIGITSAVATCACAICAAFIKWVDPETLKKVEAEPVTEEKKIAKKSTKKAESK